MSYYADNLRKSIINTGKKFTEMAEEVRRKQNKADREDIDKLWQQALIESVNDGEQFTRYHFATLVAAAEREACAKLCEDEAEKWEGEDGPICAEARMCAVAIRARG